MTATPRTVAFVAAVVASLGFAPAWAPAAETASAGATVLSDPVFHALLIDGKNLAGRVRQLGPKGELVLVPAEGKDQVVPLDALVKLTREGTTVSFSGDGAVVLLPNGDQLFRAVIGTATDAALEVQQYALGNLSIPLDCLVGIVQTLPQDDDERDVLINRVRDESRRSEVLWLANGDRATGGFLGLDEQKIKFQTDVGTLSLDRAGITAIGFDPAQANYPRPEGTFLELTLADGSRFGVAGPRVEQGHVVATTRFGVVVRAPIADLVAVHVQSSALAYLTDRAATKEQYISYIGPTRPFRRNLTVDGHPFRLGGQVYERGLGTQSRTFLAYRLTPGDQRFQALVGLDDRAGPLGSVVFRVLVDGRERFVSPSMSVRDAPKGVDVDVSGAKLLVLVTDFGERGEVRDVADWIEARLIRAAPGASAR